MNVSVRPGGGSAFAAIACCSATASASSVPHPLASSFAPGSWMCATMTIRSSGFDGARNLGDDHAARPVVERGLHVHLARGPGPLFSRSRIFVATRRLALNAERLGRLVVRHAAPLEDVPLIGERELRGIVRPDVRRDRRRDDAGRAARLDRLLPQLPRGRRPEHHGAFHVLPVEVGRRAGADVNHRRVDDRRPAVENELMHSDTRSRSRDSSTSPVSAKATVPT